MLSTAHTFFWLMHYPFLNSLVKAHFTDYKLKYTITGKSSHAVATKKKNLLRSTSPRSPVASGSAFESGEGSDDEDNMTDNSKADNTYLHTNGNAVSLLLLSSVCSWLISLSPSPAC